MTLEQVRCDGTTAFDHAAVMVRKALLDRVTKLTNAESGVCNSTLQTKHLTSLAVTFPGDSV